MGEAWRQLAQQRGLSILELNQYSETHPLDEQMDQVLIDLATAPEPIIFDSRLAWHFVPQSFKVYLTVSPEVAAARIFNDQQRSGAESYQDLAQAYQQIVARRQSENQRYQQKYGIDCASPANYDLVVDTSDLTPAVVAKIIEESFKTWQAAKKPEN